MPIQWFVNSVGRRFLYLRHVARHARRAGGCRPVAHSLVTSGAALVICLGGRDQRRVRVVAGEAGETASTFPETGRLAEGSRLMADVPWIRPVPLHPGLRRLAMAGPAERIEFDRVEASRIANCAGATPGRNVRRAGPVTRFAADSVLRRLNGKPAERVGWPVEWQRKQRTADVIGSKVG